MQGKFAAASYESLIPATLLSSLLVSGEKDHRSALSDKEGTSPQVALSSSALRLHVCAPLECVHVLLFFGVAKHVRTVLDQLVPLFGH